MAPLGPGILAQSPEAGSNPGYYYLLAIVLAAIPLLGVMKCISIGRRATTNRKAALALAAVCAALALPGLTLLAAMVASHFSTAATLRTVVLMNTGILMFALLLLAFLGAIAALVEIKRDKAARYTQGKRQAIWALIMPLVLLWIIFPISEAIRAARNAAVRYDSGDLEANRLATSPAPSGNNSTNTPTSWGKRLSEMFSSSPSRSDSTSYDSELNDDLNFRFRPLGSAWVKADAKRLNSDAALAYIRKWPDTGLYVIAERPGIELNFTLDTLKEATRVNLKSMAPDAQDLDERPLVVNGLEGVRLVSQASIGRNELIQIRWMCIHNGYAYQLILTGRSTDRSMLDQEADRIFQNFKLADPNRVCHAAGFAPLPDYAAPEDGLSLRLAGSGWHAWSNLSSLFPSASFGAMLGQDAAFIVIPLHTAELEVQTPPAVERDALLAMLGFDTAKQQLGSEQKINVDGTEGQKYSFELLRERMLYYQICLIQKDKCDYCVAAWSTKSADHAAQTLGDVVSRVHFTGIASRAPGMPQPVTVRHRYAKFLNFAGLQPLRNHEYAASELYFLRALEFDPEMSVALDNFVNACIETSRFQPALEAMTSHEAAWKNNRELQLSHAWLLSKMNRNDEAIREYGAIFNSSTRNDLYFAAYVQLLEDGGRRDEALAAIDRYLAAGDSISIVISKAQLLAHSGKQDQAIELLKARNAQTPGNAEIVYALVEILREAERLTEAHTLAADLLKTGYASTDNLVLKGTLELRLKWYKEAKATLEQALRQAPADERIQNLVNHVSAMLGEGANVDIKQALTPVAVPPELIAGQPPPLPEAVLADAPAYYRNYTTAIEFVPGKVHRVSTYESIQIVNDTGVSRHSTMEFEFDPVAERIFVNQLEVFDAEGKSVATGDVADYFVADIADSEVASHKKALHVPVPGARPGYRVEVCVTTEDISPPKSLPYSKHYLSAGTPICRELLVVAADPAQIACDMSAGLKPQFMPGCVYWQVDAPTAIVYENMQDDFDSYLPVVRLSDPQTTWKGEVDEYHTSIQSLLPVSDSTRKLAAEIVGNATEPSVKITALVRYVQKQLTYKAIEFGRRARVMNSVERTLRNRYGDCKDHSLLLCQLLQAAGIQAQLALIDTSGAISNKTPSLDQFNHMVVFVSTPSGERFLDATVKDCDPAVPVPYGLSGRDALVLDWSSPRLVRVPEYPADSNLVDVERHLRLAADGTAEADDRLSYTGYYAVSVRNYFKGLDPAQRKSALESYFNIDSSGEIQSLSVESLDDPQRPVVFTVKYKFDHALHRGGDQLVGRLPAPWEFNLFTAPPVDKRTAPVRLQFPLRVSSKISIDAPPGYALPAANTLTLERLGNFFLSQRQPTANGAQLVLKCIATRPAGRYPAARYQTYREELDQIRELFSPSIALKLAGK